MLANYTAHIIWNTKENILLFKFYNHLWIVQRIIHKKVMKILNDWYFHCRFECYTEGTADSPYDYVYVKVTTVRSLRSARPQVCILTFSSLCLSIEDYGQ